MNDMDEYVKLRYATDAIEAFNIFVKRNCDPTLYAHFMDDDDNEAEYVREAIRQQCAKAKTLGKLDGIGLASDAVTLSLQLHDTKPMDDLVATLRQAQTEHAE